MDDVVGAGSVVAGRYRLLAPLASGAMGSVWRARDVVLDRDVAVKQVHAGGPDQRERVLREGRLAARLTHPHAVAVLDLVQQDGQPWLVMELVASRSLAAVVHEDGPLAPAAAARLGAQVAGALAAAHAAGVLHRDVKPGNVLVGHDAGTVKLADFGISSAQDDVTVTRAGVVIGTPAYLAPEVARGEPATPAADVFALGATVFTAVEGAPPAGLGHDPLELLRRVAAGDVAAPRRAGPLAPVLARLLEPDPARRPTAAQARDLLSDVADAAGAPDPAPVPARRGAWLAAAAAAVLVLVGLGVLATRDPAPAQARPAAGTTAAAPPSPTATAAASTPAPTTTTPTATTTTAAPTTTTTAPPTTTSAAPDPTARAEQAVTDYFALLPGSTAAAYERLGPVLAAQGYPAYAAFWDDIDAVELGPVQASADGTTVELVETFTRGATTIVERHRLGLTTAPDGTVLVDTDTLLSSAGG